MWNFINISKVCAMVNTYEQKYFACQFQSLPIMGLIFHHLQKTKMNKVPNEQNSGSADGVKCECVDHNLLQSQKSKHGQLFYRTPMHTN